MEKTQNKSNLMHAIKKNGTTTTGEIAPYSTKMLKI